MVRLALMCEFLDEACIRLQGCPAIQDGLMITPQRQALMVPGLPLVCIKDLIILQLTSLCKQDISSSVAGAGRGCMLAHMCCSLLPYESDKWAQVCRGLQRSATELGRTGSSSNSTRNLRQNASLRRSTFMTQGGSGISQLPSPTFPPPAWKLMTACTLSPCFLAFLKSSM